MSKFYNSKRTRNLYDPKSDKPFKISRSKLDLFLKCSRCFYLDRRLGVGQPPGFPFNLNSAVDALLKKEFDHYRAKKECHPICIEHQVTAIPFDHPNMDTWRDSLRGGVQFEIPKTNLILTGGVDDIWQCLKTQELFVVDYKATSKSEQVSLDADWQIGYKRQAEIYQFLLRQNGFKVSNTAYFVYCNGLTKADRFDRRLDFEISLLPYIGDDRWVLDCVIRAYKCLRSDDIPDSGPECDFCKYFSSVYAALNEPQ